jgi:hypothetical protein
MARGDRREAIYHDDRDRLTWLDNLDQVCRRTSWRVYGWMPSVRMLARQGECLLNATQLDKRRYFNDDCC